MTTIIFETVTYAIKARKYLLAKGIRSKLGKMNSVKNKSGCVYSLQLSGVDLLTVAMYLREAEIPYQMY